MDSVASVDPLTIHYNSSGNGDAPGGAGDAHVELPVCFIGFVPLNGALFAVVCYEGPAEIGHLACAIAFSQVDGVWFGDGLTAGQPRDPPLARKIGCLRV